MIHYLTSVNQGGEYGALTPYPLSFEKYNGKGLISQLKISKNWKFQSFGGVFAYN